MQIPLKFYRTAGLFCVVCISLLSSAIPTCWFKSKSVWLVQTQRIWSEKEPINHWNRNIHLATGHDRQQCFKVGSLTLSWTIMRLKKWVRKLYLCVGLKICIMRIKLFYNCTLSEEHSPGSRCHALMNDWEKTSEDSPQDANPWKPLKQKGQVTVSKAGSCCGSFLKQSFRNYSGFTPSSSRPNVDVSLSRILNPKFLIVCVTCKLLWIKETSRV